MPIPVPIPAGPLVVTDADIARAEDLLAKIAQVLRSGTTGGLVTTGPTLVPDSSNPAVDPATVPPVPLLLDSAEKQLYFRQLAHAIVLVAGSGGSGSLTIPLYTSSTLPAAESTRDGEFARVQDDSVDERLLFCMKKADGSYEWSEFLSSLGPLYPLPGI
jgi:hypothetical protein